MQILETWMSYTTIKLYFFEKFFDDLINSESLDVIPSVLKSL
ncbi:hypothetical protein LLB_1990 [Legionella longbeachae D-4968]|nr:hypothetical protein LLB_1990 [Legionella longbeachae D-4968]